MRRGATLEMLRLRGLALGSIRDFFRARGFVEVETPVRIPAPALELHVDAIPSGGRFLRTSPELHMKRLLAEGLSPVFQMGSCFRAGEQGERHRPEFTMLEWYRLDAGYLDILADAQALVRQVARELRTHDGGIPASPDVDAPWMRLTVEEAYLRHAGWNPVETSDPDRFDLDMVNLVEPALPRDRAVVLMDYPMEAAALARRATRDPRTAERWELYLGGLEIANAFGELTDPVEQRCRFADCAARRAGMGAEVYPLDEDFIEALEQGLAPCGGIALGVDRLLMALTGADDIAKVIPFA